MSEDEDQKEGEQEHVQILKGPPLREGPKNTNQGYCLKAFKIP